MKRIAFILTLVLLVVVSNTSAQKSAGPTGSISPANILEGYFSATGGLNSHKELVSLTTTGNFGFYLLHPLGSYTFLYQAPARDVLEVQMISHGTSWTGRRDDHLIRRSTVQGAEMINGAGMEIVEQCLVSLLEWDIRDYKKIELIGRAQVDKRWAYALRFTPSQGDPQVRYYDSENFLMVRMDQVQRFRESKNGREMAYAVVSYFRDYRPVGALKLPHQIAVSRDIGDLTFDLAKVRRTRRFLTPRFAIDLHSRINEDEERLISLSIPGKYYFGATARWRSIQSAASSANCWSNFPCWCLRMFYSQSRGE